MAHFLTVSIGIRLAAWNFSEICQNDSLTDPEGVGWLSPSLGAMSTWSLGMGSCRTVSSFRPFSTSCSLLRVSTVNFCFPPIVPLLRCQQSSWLELKSGFSSMRHELFSVFFGITGVQSGVLHTGLLTGWQEVVSTAFRVCFLKFQILKRKWRQETVSEVKF